MSAAFVRLVTPIFWQNSLALADDTREWLSSAAHDVLRRMV
jgi:hypothetical protein